MKGFKVKREGGSQGDSTANACLQQVYNKCLSNEGMKNEVIYVIHTPSKWKSWDLNQVYVIPKF